jgi:hypothetical protein
MSIHNPYPNEADMKVRVMVGDPVAIAYLWLVAYLENINSMITGSHDEFNYQGELSFDELIDTALSHVGDDDPWGDYITRGGIFEGFRMDPTFWDKLAILKEIDIPQSQRGTIFSCSC